MCHSCGGRNLEKKKKVGIILTIKMNKSYFVYILSNFTRTTIYIGVTSNLEKRLYEHKNHLVKGFTEKYNCNILVYFEETSDIYIKQ